VLLEWLPIFNALIIYTHHNIILPHKDAPMMSVLEGLHSIWNVYYIYRNVNHDAQYKQPAITCAILLWDGYHGIDDVNNIL